MEKSSGEVGVTKLLIKNPMVWIGNPSEPYTGCKLRQSLIFYLLSCSMREISKMYIAFDELS